MTGRRQNRVAGSGDAFSASPAREAVRVFAPATIGNVGPGFDVLGLAVDGPGDTVLARKSDTPGVQLSAVLDDDGRLPRDPAENTATIAARETLRAAGFDVREVGVEIELHKGMPIGSGLGSSAASAAAAALATNLLVGSPLRKRELVGPCVEAEAAVSGRHADNVAPALLGGLILVRAMNPGEPIELVRLPIPQGLQVVVVTPAFELSTRKAREALPREVPISAMVRNAAQIASLVSACYSSDLGLLSRCIVDDVVTPARAALIPGAENVMRAALDSGAVGSSISGAGPSIFALARSPKAAQRIAKAMVGAFRAANLEASTVISPVDCPGARMV